MNTTKTLKPATMSARTPRRAVWVGTHGRERVDVVVLRECRAWTLCRVVSTGAVERMHPADLRPPADAPGHDA